MLHNNDAIERLQRDVIKLERLYSEQSELNQIRIIEQERLEAELLVKDRLILKQTNNITQLKALNNELSLKFQNEAARNLTLETSIQSTEMKLNAIKSEYDEKHKSSMEKSENTIASLEMEIQFNREINDSLNSRLKHLEATLETLQTGPKIEDRDLIQNDEVLSESKVDNFQDTTELTFLQPDPDEIVTYEFLANDAPNDQNLSQESDSLHEKSMKRDFEVNSLKKEVSQLYDYINMLLRKEKSISSNLILKEKLVKRGILRVSSIGAKLESRSNKDKCNGTSDLISQSMSPKRSLSLNVQPMSMQYQTSQSWKPRITKKLNVLFNEDDHLDQNSDLEDTENELNKKQIVVQNSLFPFFGYCFSNNVRINCTTPIQIMMIYSLNFHEEESNVHTMPLPEPTDYNYPSIE